MNVTITPTKPEHLRLLAENLRWKDAAELKSAGTTPSKALWRSYRQSSLVRTAFAGGDIAAIWGVGGGPFDKIGRPWLLTAPPIERVKKAFIRQARLEVAQMLVVFPEIRGYVDAQYTGAVRLLEILGFTMSKEFPFGPNGSPFRQYSMRRG